MYGYVVNIESAQPLRRLSITELNFDKVVANNTSVQHKLNSESNSNEYSFNLNPFEETDNQNENQSQPMIMGQTPGPASPQTIAYPRTIEEEPSVVIRDHNGVNNYPNGNNNTNFAKNNRVAPQQPSNDKIKPLAKNAHDQFEVVWHKLSYTLTKMSIKSKNRRNILQNLNGNFRSGEVTAIMGPSGAGKSTLLEIICGEFCVKPRLL